nr:hypothetical protein [Allomuricauda sp.]
MKAVLKYFGVVLFISIVLTKASAFHIHEHHDTFNGQETHCELCLFIHESQQAVTVTFPLEGVEELFSLPQYRVEISSFDQPLVLHLWETYLFSRPPPRIV